MRHLSHYTDPLVDTVIDFSKPGPVASASSIRNYNWWLYQIGANGKIKIVSTKPTNTAAFAISQQASSPPTSS